MVPKGDHALSSGSNTEETTAGFGAGNVVGLSYVTNCVGFKYDLTKHAELGVGYEFQVSQPRMLFSNMLGAQVILRY